MQTGNTNSYLYEKVCQLIFSMIDNGTLVSGDKVPSLRKMSRQLNVSIATVTQAYCRLEEQGMLLARPQSGFYVAAPRTHVQKPTTPELKTHPRKLRLGNTIPSVLRDCRQPDIIGFGVANPDTNILPTRALARSIRKISRNPEQVFDYAPAAGMQQLRKQIALRFAASGKAVDFNEVIITNGATEALLLSLQAVAKAGDVVAVSTPSYFSTLQMIENYGILVVEVNSDVETGISLPSLREVLNQHKVKAVITSSNFSNPTGASIPDANKKALVELLAERKVPLIEDEVYGELYFEGKKPLSCKHYDTQGLVLHCSSVSKTLAPGFRIGWVLAGNYTDTVMEKKQLTSLAATSLQQLVLSDFFIGGQFVRVLAKARRTYQRKLELMRNAIATHFPNGTRITSPKGGFSLWVQLPRGINTFELYSLAIDKNISFTPGPLFSATGKYTNYLRICASVPWEEEAQQAIVTLGKLIKSILEQRQRGDLR